MNDFIATLVALRSGLGKVGQKAKSLAKGTLENIKNLEEREKQILDTERERNKKMIIDNFGSVENYQKFLEENPMPMTTLGDFFMRVLKSRK